MSEESLREGIESQLTRLLSQLEDLDEMKGDLEPHEYDAERSDTLKQLEEFQNYLANLGTGNLTLSSELDRARLATRAAISDAFKTPQVLRLFAQKQPAALRRRLAEIDRDVKLAKLDFDAVKAQAAEILTALKKLGEPLSAKEAAFLERHQTAALSEFEAVGDDSGEPVKVPRAAPSSRSAS